MVDRVGVDGLDHRDVVHDSGDVRQEFADPHAALAVLRELEHRRRDRQPRLAAGHRGDALALADGLGQILVEVRVELGLVIQRVNLRRPAVQVQVNQPLRLRREVRQAGDCGMDARAAGLGRRTGGVAHHRGHRERTGAQAGGAEELASGLVEEVVVEGVHGKSFLATDSHR